MRTFYLSSLCFLFCLTVSMVYGQITVSSPTSGTTVNQCGTYIVRFDPGTGFSSNASAEVHLNNSSGPIVQTLGYPNGVLDLNFDNVVSASPLTVGNSYQVKVYDAFNPSNFAWSGIFTIAPLQAPTSISLVNNDQDYIEISWPQVPGASSYGVDVATTIDFSSGIVWSNHSASGTDPFGLYVTGLNPLTTYYVRIKSSSLCGTSGYSGTFSFSTLLCTALSTPIAFDANSITTCSFNFTWSTVPHATSYDLTITKSGDSPVTISGITTTHYDFQATSCDPNSLYSYTVKARNNCTVSNDSKPNTVITKVLRVPGHYMANGSDESWHVTWDGIEGAVHYVVQTGRGTDFSVPSTPEVTENVNTPSIDFEVVPCLFYYIRVKAVAITGEESPYTTWFPVGRLGDCEELASVNASTDLTKANYVLSPNPADKTLTIELSSTFRQEAFGVEITDGTGHKVTVPYQLSEAKATFDLSGINPGIYIVTVNDGQEIHRSRFLKK